ncbi:Gfo/Idh/MocA family oxidoreductase [Francisellaceae bacterium]|nr:Gfo/Idh/MocA family oxidoreductase [Francisellaceae bacterium]
MEINWGIIGCGAVTEIKSGPAFQMVEGFNLTAVMRRNAELAKDYADRHNVDEYFSDAMELINSDNVDAVYIATPPDTHKLYGLMVAGLGKPCCIEKPLSPSYIDSLEICQAFKNNNVPLFVSYYRRSLPRFNKIKDWLNEGKIGEVRHISWHLNKPCNNLDLSGGYNWRTDKKIALGGYFDDLASHGLDLFSYLLGEIEVVKGLGVNQQNIYSSYDAVTACWKFKNNVTGAGSWNFGGYSRQDKVTIYGNEGEISFSIFDEENITIKSKTMNESLFIENPKNIQLYHVQNLKNHLINNLQHPSTGETALHTSWVMDQILF